MRRRSRKALISLAGAAVALAAVYATGGQRAYADATAPPPLPPSECPAAQYPPAYYQNPPAANLTPPPNHVPVPVNPGAVPYHGKIPYQVPFSGAILDGQITIPPNVVVPHIYAAVCGLVSLPQLTGTILPGDVHFAPNSPNVYVAGLEALPIKVTFTQPLTAPINPQAAPNGGLNLSLTTSNEATQSVLGMSCSVALDNVTFTTQTSGKLTGRPVTGPTSAGEAEVVSNDFPVPAVQTSPSCPPAVADTFNKLLGLPLPAGVATFSAPFSFVFELDCPPPPGTSASSYPYQCPTRQG